MVTVFIFSMNGDLGILFFNSFTLIFLSAQVIRKLLSLMFWATKWMGIIGVGT